MGCAVSVIRMSAPGPASGRCLQLGRGSRHFSSTLMPKLAGRNGATWAILAGSDQLSR